MRSLLHQLGTRRLPDFIGIGAMRAGSSWLRKNLEHHPDIWMATPKELHFFDRHFEERRWKFLPAETDAKLRYAAHFTSAPRPPAIAGEITPAYAILPDARIQLIKRWMPDLRLIYILRDPVERAWSHARKDYAVYWGKPLQDASLQDLRPFFESPDVAARGDYAACLTHWRRHFPRERIHVCFMEEIASSPMEVLRESFRYLGVSPDVPLDAEKVATVVNPRPRVPIPDDVRAYLEDRLYAQNAALESMLDRPVPWKK